MRKLGIDYGDARIGLALSDSLCIIASPLEVYKRKNDDRDFLYLKNIIQSNEVDTVVVGLPINMDGSHGNRAEVTKAFAQKLSQFTSAEIVFKDERLSTVAANRIMIEAEVRRENRNALVDKLSACIILQGYLDKIKK